jgi:hypothetical protein
LLVDQLYQETKALILVANHKNVWFNLIGSRKPEAGNQKQETRSRKPASYWTIV